MKLIEKYKLWQNTPIEEAPWDVKRVFEGKLSLNHFHECVCLTSQGDYVKIDEARYAVEWLVSQLGGKVKWKS